MRAVAGERVQNLLTLEVEYEPSKVPGHRFAGARLTEEVGAVATGMGVYELDPGNGSWPYHFEAAEEEWLIVVAGEVTLRAPDGESVLRAGDVVCFPAGPDGAHHVRNAGEDPVRVAIVSTKNEFGIAEYPDSDKVGIWAGGTNYMLRRSEHLEYWDGER